LTEIEKLAQDVHLSTISDWVHHLDTPELLTTQISLLVAISCLTQEAASHLLMHPNSIESVTEGINLK
jgi:hypothetical protein